MKKLLHFMAGILCFLLLPGWLHAQEKTITGTVTDAGLKPLAGVNLIIDKTTKGTVTNAEGKFSLTIPAGAKLVVSEAGFKTKIITIINLFEATKKAADKAKSVQVIVAPPSIFLRELRKGTSLGGLTIRDLIDEGRK